MKKNQLLKKRNTFIIGFLIVLGLIAIIVFSQSGGENSSVLAWFQSFTRTTATLYFGDPTGEYLVPVTRVLSKPETAPDAIVEALIAGPSDESGLTNLIPVGTEIENISFLDGIVELALFSPQWDSSDELPILALSRTLTSLSTVAHINLTINRDPFAQSLNDRYLLYFMSGELLIAVPATAQFAETAIVEYLEEPQNQNLIGLPSDVELLDYNFYPTNGSLDLNFSYTPALRAFALEDPDAMRLVLLGIVATMTNFSEIESVTLNFDGHATLGSGQCADLISTIQFQPTMLNDERLIGK